MATVDPSYEIQSIIVDPSLDKLRVVVQLKYMDATSGLPDETLPISNKVVTLSTPQIGGQITAIKAMVLSAAKLDPEIDSQDVIFTPPPVFPEDG